MRMAELLAGPLAYPFMVRGLLAALTVGIVCAVLGTFVVLRGMAFLGDALAHAILPGVAVGYLVGGGASGPIYWWAMGAGVGTAVAVGALSRDGHIKQDVAIGVIFAGMFALGIALISTGRGYAVDLTHFLFGDVLGVSQANLRMTGIVGGLVVALILLFYKEFLVLSFDPVLAATLRMPTSLFHYALMVMLAATIVISLQTVGVALTVAMLVTPAATAQLLTRRVPTMMLVGALIGALSAVTGLYLSFHVNMSSGAAIVLVCTACFLLAYLLAPNRGVVWQSSRRRRVRTEQDEPQAVH
jgi:ABC-type Mn2+/Zn2+ transport system permease subunit